MNIKSTKCTLYIPNGHKKYQHFPFLGPTKFIQIAIFGLKIHHLATLLILAHWFQLIFICLEKPFEKLQNADTTCPNYVHMYILALAKFQKIKCQKAECRITKC
jgi:hypothetical protein